MYQREAERDVAVTTGGPTWERTLEPVLTGKDQGKTRQNMANRRRRVMSGLTEAKGVELNVGVRPGESDV